MRQSVPIGFATEIVIFGAGLIFLLALALGVWKYHQMATSETHLAHPYVDTAHRAALLYSFAALLVATLVEFSGWSQTVNLACAGVLLAYFVITIVLYMWLGWQEGPGNQWTEPMPGRNAYMFVLIAAEMGAFGVLLAGFAAARF
jgi:hypothetical protein